MGGKNAPAEFNQNSLHSVISFPLSKAGKLGVVNLVTSVLASLSADVLMVPHTLPDCWLTHGMLTREMNWIVGGLSG